MRLAWARHREGHLRWLLTQVERHPYANRNQWVDDVEVLDLRLTAASLIRRRLELAEP